jgi:hypothetical protein
LGYVLVLEVGMITALAAVFRRESVKSCSPGVKRGRCGRMGRMAKKLWKLRPGVWTLTVAAWKIYRRLPAKQRKQVLDATRKHGPRLAKKAYASYRRKK